MSEIYISQNANTPMVRDCYGRARLNLKLATESSGVTEV
jgi:hypothetical protein